MRTARRTLKKRAIHVRQCDDTVGEGVLRERPLLDLGQITGLNKSNA